MSPTAIAGVRLPLAAAPPLQKLQSMLVRAMEQIAMPRNVCQIA
jgi:hypothetical protein